MKKFSVSRTALVLLASAAVSMACQQEEIPATITGLPEDGVTFLWSDGGENNKNSQTVAIDANYEWTFEEIDEDDIIEVTRPEGKSELVITPTGRNYSLDVLTASIRITAGTGATAAERTISVSQGANTKTYLTFLDEDLSGDNPIIQFPSALGGEPAVRKINISTNNALDIKVSSNQDIDITEGEGEDSQALTKVRLPDDYGWMSYEISEQVSEEGIVTVLTLTSDINPSTTETLKVAIDVVSGNDDINNDVVTRRIALVSLPSTPAIVVNPEMLTFACNATEPQTFTVISNVKFKKDEDWQSLTGTWEEYPEIKLVEENGIEKVYSVTVPEYALAEDRSAQIGFMRTDEDGNVILGEGVLADQLEVRQTAAPEAAITLNESELIFNNGEDTKLVTMTSSLSEKYITVSCEDEAGEPVDWFDAKYDAASGTLVVTVKAAPEDADNVGVLTVTVGEGTNTAEASIRVRQLSSAPSVALSPAEVILNESGDPVTVKVITNQSSWSIDSDPSGYFTATADLQNNTVTVSCKPMTAGSETYTFTVTAGGATAELTVSQSKTYKVGDPFTNADGDVVGIVYEVTDGGFHGKAFSLTVDNMNERVFFTEAGWQEPGFVAGIAENALPLSMTDGQDNCERMKNEPGWSEKFQLLKWVEDLGDEQGVDWYIPSIEELKDLLEYMSGASFKTVQHETSDTDGNPVIHHLDAIDIDESATVEVSWNRIRSLYSTYTGQGSGYDEEQYVVFEPYTSLSDPGDHRHLVDNLFLKKGDNNAYRWISSTVITNSYSTYVYYVGMKDATTGYPYPTVRDNINAISDTGDGIAYPIDYDANTGSVHPICRF